MEEAVFVKMEEAAPKVEDGSERAEVGLSGTMTRDLTSEVEKGLKELDSTSDHPRIPFDGDRNSKEVWLRTEGGENIRLVHTSSRGFGLQFPAARRRPLSEKDDLAFVMVTKLHPTEDVLKFVQSWNSKAKKYKDNDGKNSPPLFYTSDSFSLSFSWLLLTLSPFSLSLSLSSEREAGYPEDERWEECGVLRRLSFHRSPLEYTWQGRRWEVTHADARTH